VVGVGAVGSGARPPTPPPPTPNPQSPIPNPQSPFFIFFKIKKNIIFNVY